MASVSQLKVNSSTATGTAEAFGTPWRNYDQSASSGAAIYDGSHLRLPLCVEQLPSQKSPLGNKLAG